MGASPNHRDGGSLDPVCLDPVWQEEESSHPPAAALVAAAETTRRPACRLLVVPRLRRGQPLADGCSPLLAGQGPDRPGPDSFHPYD